ncbi:conserved protein of unknown function [Rhodovastum atsumiense]|nr:conserved protein of unknown function [Rhodovastum atsumiense]
MAMVTLAVSSAQAVEGNSIIYPNGFENFGAGIVPPPGTYYLNNTEYYTARRMNDGAGNNAIPGFGLNALVNASRVIQSWDLPVLGGNLFSQIIVPLVYLNVNVPGRAQNRAGIGNVTLTPAGVAWHFGDLHVATAVDVNLPPPAWNKNWLANLGHNYFQFEPVLAVTYARPGGIEASVKAMYDFNTENTSTNYLSGQTAHVDFALGYNVWDTLKVGAVGYYLTQTTADSGSGAAGANRTEALAIGPGMTFMYKGLFFWANWQHEVMAHNHTQGDALWLKVGLRF